MKAHGTLHYTEFPKDPFWTLTPAAPERPLGGWSGSPDNMPAGRIDDFIAYAFACCWDSIHPDYFDLWNLVERQDLQWLRENFLRILEQTLIAHYTGALEPGRGYDWGEWAEHLSIGNLDEGDSDEARYTWFLDIVESDGDDSSICIALSCEDVKAGGPGGDDQVIWLRLTAIEDRAACKAAIERARAANALGRGEMPMDWTGLV